MCSRQHFKTSREMYCLDLSWNDCLHIGKFERLEGTNRRRGNADFLKDILDEYREMVILVIFSQILVVICWYFLRDYQ